MPVVGTTAYNTAGQITALVRSLLNDAAGNLFTDAVLLPYVNSGYRKVQRALANVQSGTFLTDNTLLVVPAVTQVDASAQVSITDATAPPNQQGILNLTVTGPDHPYSDNFWKPGHIIGYEHTFIATLGDFLSTMSRQAPSHADLDAAIAVQRVLDAIESSAAARNWVQLTD